MIITVFLTGVKGKAKPYICPKCLNNAYGNRRIVFEYYNERAVTVMTPIAIEDTLNSNPVDKLCRFCKTIYRIL